MAHMYSTTPEGRHYQVLMLLEPNEKQQVVAVKAEVLEVLSEGL